jgi:hypothetical protein
MFWILAMTLAIDCLCGAHLEIDDKFAGQTIQCPDCRRDIQAPATEVAAARRRTSGFALASVILALVGAFTVVGTLLAAILGGLALRSIARHPDRLAGASYAIIGILLGIVLTAVSVFAYLKADIFGLDSLLREPEWAGKLDYNGPMDLGTEKFTFSRPSKLWGVYHASDSQGAAGPRRGSVILVNVRDDAHAIVFSAPLLEQDPDDAAAFRNVALADFGKSELVDLLTRQRNAPAPLTPQVRSIKQISSKGGREVQELLLDVRLGRHERTFLVRIFHHGDLYVVAAGARKNRFAGMEDELRRIVSSFKIEK